MDVLHKALKWVDHNRGVTAALVLAILLCVALVGCPVTTASLVTPDKDVTVTEFEGEVITLSAQLDKDAAAIDASLTQHNIDVEAFNQRVDLGQEELTKKVELRTTVVNTIGGVGTALVSGTLTPQAGVAAVIQIATLLAAVGLGYDNRRKDKVMADAKPAAPVRKG